MNRDVINGLLVAIVGTLAVLVLGGFYTGTDFWVGAAFFSFWGVVTYMRVPQAVVASLDQRRTRIENEIEEARVLREEAQKTLASYERRTREAEAEAEAIISAAKRDAEAMAADAKAKMNETMERRTAAATLRIEQAEAQALADVRRAAADAAAKAAEAILRDEMQGETGARTIDSSIDAVRARLS
ncbi:MAG: ATP F0F1 synthase subunit B [Pseudomonadota bacterium]